MTSEFLFKKHGDQRKVAQGFKGTEIIDCQPTILYPVEIFLQE